MRDKFLVPAAPLPARREGRFAPLCALIICALICAGLAACGAASPKNLVPRAAADFEGGEVPSGWSVIGSGELRTDSAGMSGRGLLMTGRENPWDSPAFNLYELIAPEGPGSYTIGLWVRIERSGEEAVPFGSLIRAGSPEDENSFLRESGGNYYCRLGEESALPGRWTRIERTLTVSKGDIGERKAEWLLCFDGLSPEADMKIDGFYVVKNEIKENFPKKAELWRAAEILLESPVEYENPLTDAELELVLTHEKSGERLVVPGFWDGGGVWKIRFALTKEGEWSYETKCSDGENTGLSGRKGTVRGVAYKGGLDVYTHGFVRTEEGLRYFVHADGTPFFYLGDTHWNMPAEDFDSAGPHAPEGTEIESHFKHIVDRRVGQGFTVYQSEPIGAKYNLADGLSGADLPGFADIDRRFEYIADKGLVHANAMLFFTSELVHNLDKYPDDYLEALSRYWVARYGAYPVLWTLAQECDDDFYRDRGEHDAFTAETNPWKKVCEYVYRHDAYKSPMSAHQEYASTSSKGGVNASWSAFRDLPGHTFYAMQWAPNLNFSSGYTNLVLDYWENAQGKPVINYEGKYDRLWTKEFGARAQGWIAYLNGIYGYGYGAADIWLYRGEYDLNTESGDGRDIITPEDKAVKWPVSLEFPSAVQMGYMREFFGELEWWKLIPRFDSAEWADLTPSWAYALASDESRVFVAYFYNDSLETGTINNMSDSPYGLVWFNPRTNERTAPRIVTAENGVFEIGDKPDGNDWVLLLTEEKG